MKKGVTIFLGVMVAALMLTSFISAVNSEILIARNAALVVESKPVVASDATLQELESEKYDSMIRRFQDHTAVPDSDPHSVPANNPETEQAMSADESDKTVEAESTPHHAAADTSAEDHDENVPEQEPSGMTNDDMIFTVQTGSYTHRFNAESKYNSLLRDMNAADLDHLRIEKVGEYYTVRLGKFDHYVTAMKYLNAMKPQLSSSIVLKAYVKNERIVKVYSSLLAGK